MLSPKSIVLGTRLLSLLLPALCLFPTCTSDGGTSPIAVNSSDTAVPLTTEPEIILGFLEDVDRYVETLQYADNPPQELPSAKHRSLVRKCFFRKGGVWFAYPDLTESSRENSGYHDWWYATKHGEVLGRIETKRYPDFLDTMKNSQELLTISFEPLDLKDDSDFSSFGDDAMRRPIVLTNVRTHPDPEGWRETGWRPRVQPKLNVLNPLTECRNRVDTPTMVLTTDDVVIGKTYRNRHGDWLSTLTVRKSTPGYEDSWSNYSTFWFGRADGCQVVYLGADLALIDVVDLDGDGKSEFLFWIDSLIANGYQIFLHGFVDSNEFFWGQ